MCPTPAQMTSQSTSSQYCARATGGPDANQSATTLQIYCPAHDAEMWSVLSSSRGCNTALMQHACTSHNAVIRLARPCKPHAPTQHTPPQHSSWWTGTCSSVQASPRAVQRPPAAHTSCLAVAHPHTHHALPIHNVPDSHVSSHMDHVWLTCGTASACQAHKRHSRLRRGRTACGT